MTGVFVYNGGERVNRELLDRPKFTQLDLFDEDQ
jgi:hypothetical protein